MYKVEVLDHPSVYCNFIGCFLIIYIVVPVLNNFLCSLHLVLWYLSLLCYGVIHAGFYCYTSIYYILSNLACHCSAVSLWMLSVWFLSLYNPVLNLVFSTFHYFITVNQSLICTINKLQHDFLVWWLIVLTISFNSDYYTNESLGKWSFKHH